MITEKISNFLMKLIFVPFVFLVMYFVAFQISNSLFCYFSNTNDLYSLISIIILTSLISFIITGIINMVISKIWTNKKFNNWFEWSHLVLIYISGMVTLIYTLQPLLIEEGLIQKKFDDLGYMGAVLGFFIAISNYYFYKSIVISKDIDLKESLINIKNRIMGLLKK